MKRRNTPAFVLELVKGKLIAWIHSLIYSLTLIASFRKNGGVDFNVVNLNVNATFFNDQPTEKSIDILSLQQLEKDTVFVATNRRF